MPSSDHLGRVCFYTVDDRSGRTVPVLLGEYLRQEVPGILDEAKEIVRLALQDSPPQLSLFEPLEERIRLAVPDHWGENGQRDYLARWFYVFAGELPIQAIIDHLSEQPDIVNVIAGVGSRGNLFALHVLDTAVSVFLTRSST